LGEFLFGPPQLSTDGDDLSPDAQRTVQGLVARLKEVGGCILMLTAAERAKDFPQ
jgi:hypothetical protein